MLKARTQPAMDDEDRVTPIILLPSQLAARHAATPECALLLSVVADAVECFQKHHRATAGPRRRLFDDAEEWIFGAADDAPFSFEEACAFLSLDADCLRRGLRRWRARQAGPDSPRHRRDDGACLRHDQPDETAIVARSA